MKRKSLTRVLSVIMSAAIIASSIQFTIPVVVYAEEENSAVCSEACSYEEAVAAEPAVESCSAEEYKSEAPSDVNSLSEEVNSAESVSAETLSTESVPEETVPSIAQVESVPEKTVPSIISEEAVPEEVAPSITPEEAVPEEVAPSMAPVVTVPEEIVTEETVSENIEANESVPEEKKTGNSTDTSSEKEEPAEGAGAIESISPVTGNLNEPIGTQKGDIYPTNTYAKEGYGDANETRNAPDTLIETLANGLKLVLAGASSATKIFSSETETTVSGAIFDFLTNGEEELEYLHSRTFIDAEKYSIVYEGYDQNYCWAGTASNLLWLSGWGKAVLEYGNEDQIMSDFHDKFYDEPNEPVNAINWLFDNYLSLDVSINPNSTIMGKATSVCISEAISSYENTVNALDNLASLADIANRSIAIQCRWTEDGHFADGSHWLTAVGVVMDEAATNLTDKFKAIILADSDDTPGKSTTCPSTEESYNQRKDTVNLYKISRITTTIVDGLKCWSIPGYDDAVITGIESILNYSEQLKENITETHGTTNTVSDLELLDYFEEIYTYGENAETPQETFSGEPGNLRVGYMNSSSKSCQNIEVPIKVTIYGMDGQQISSKVYYVAVENLEKNSNGYFDINIDDFKNELDAGEYRLGAVINPYGVDGYLQEAYYLNNKEIYCCFTLTEEKGGFDDETDIPTVNSHSEDNAPNTDTMTDISSDTLKAIEQLFIMSKVTYFVQNTVVNPSSDKEYRVFMAGAPGEFISAEIDGVSIDPSDIKLICNSANSYRILLASKLFKGLKKGPHKITIHSSRGVLPIEITITVI